MRVIVFDLFGKMAHFRKFYTNSSSLSYYFPPRTTIAGLIAGLLGYERDTYYEIFSTEKAKIAIGIRSPLRKILQIVNYVWAESVKQLNQSKGQHTQVPLEIIFPPDMKENICYRIFFHHKDEKILAEFKDRLINFEFCFPPYLGITEFVGKVEFVGEGIAEKNRADKVLLDSVVSVDYIKKNSLVLEPQVGAQYVKEKMPLSFDKDRLLKDSPKEFIGEIKTGKISLRGNVEYYKVNIKDLTLNIVFMED
ncbi:MAG: type I-B CRISPR-associated protein Cas5 [Dictyoglomus turgidum]|jgi:CRISPR-associated protein Cas5h|nr:MAG: type I-B CRISPR-associated protein Cas5 [Dictyoglomus turgidum]